jgi:hypothetical protein
MLIIADVPSHCKRFLLPGNRLNATKNSRKIVEEIKKPGGRENPPPAAKREKKQKERKSCLQLGGWR